MKKELEFPVDEQKLKDFLEYFERAEYYSTGVHYISGGFTIAEYDGSMDEDDEEDGVILLRLKWGVQSDVEDRVNTEYYRINIKTFNEVEDLKELYSLLEQE